MKKIFLVLFLTGIAFCQNDVLNNLKNKISQVNDISGEFKLTVKSGSANNASKGKFFFKKDKKYKFEMGNNILITDGQSMWNIDKKRKKVMVDNYDESNMQFSFHKFFNYYPSKCNIEKLSGNGLKMVPKHNNLGFKEAHLWIDSSNLISKVEIYDNSNNIYLFEFSDLKSNSGLADNIFTFTKTEGLKVVDLR